MIPLYVPEVGHGLVAGFQPDFGRNCQIDCGASKEFEKKAFYQGLCRINPEVFFLSHFHADHYNALVRTQNVSTKSSGIKFDIKEIYFPRIPDLPNKEEFLKCIFAMNQSVLGNQTGDMALDLLNVVARLNQQTSLNFKAASLMQGDIINVGKSRIEILWPPKVYDKAKKVVEEAIRDFNKAKEQNKELEELYKFVDENRIIDNYLRESSFHEPPLNHLSPKSKGLVPERNEEVLKPPQPEQKQSKLLVAKANKSLRHAANHFALAFRIEENLLFMGDLEEQEINLVAKELIRRNSRHYSVSIVPHHGTHWGNDLKSFYFKYAVSSEKCERARYLRPEYKAIADMNLSTCFHGDIHLPLQKRCCQTCRRCVGFGL